MRIDYLSSYDRSFRKLRPSLQKEAELAIGRLMDSLVSGIRPQGLGLRKLRNDFWEVRIDLAHRILFRLRKDWLTVVLVGSHNDIHRYVKDF